MRCGLFGKLAAKRDFVSIAAPRKFLRLWEPWVEQGMAIGRANFGEVEWKTLFNSAPIWRFWLGAELCGEAVVGALMPSIDALGRLFPLTLIGAAEPEEDLASPDLDSREAWFARVESFLLSTLDWRMSFETAAAALEGLGALSPAERAPCPSEIFAAMRAERSDFARSTASFWWTIGGDDCGPLAYLQEFMPPPAALADMLTVRQRHRPGADVEAESRR